MSIFQGLNAIKQTWWDFGFVDWDKILNLIDGESGKKIFSKSHVLFRHKNKLVLREINQINDKKYIIQKLINNICLENGTSLSFTEASKIEKNNLNIVTVDKGKLLFPLVYQITCTEKFIMIV